MTEIKTACVGRPRGFDIDFALAQALDVFWRNGYEGASLSELTAAMGIKKPSLYAAFGNKEQLFLKAIDLYESRPESFFNQAFQCDHIGDVIKGLLLGAAMQFTDTNHPQGCALANSTLSCSEASESIKQAILERKAQHNQNLVARFETAKKQGELKEECCPEDLARLMAILFQGMSVQASEGTNVEALIKVAQMAVDCVLSQYVNK
ncbi:TetR/AcrR family transcriptional regulator [Shewanella sp. HL-SH8]|uniref:TetR/AcrR family transcriptional regulator n=1 Tax=unclassified Shewanella TaxID=196818 RepID=UPI003EB87EE4